MHRRGPVRIRDHVQFQLVGPGGQHKLCCLRKRLIWQSQPSCRRRKAVSVQIAVQWRDPEVFRLCDLNTPNGGIDTNADPDCNTRSETPFQSLPQPDRPCQMQAQVSRDGLISMTDHIVGPTPYYLGNASTSKEMYGLRAEYGVDGMAWSSVHTGIEPQPWLQTGPVRRGGEDRFYDHSSIDPTIVRHACSRLAPAAPGATGMASIRAHSRGSSLAS